jgi:hypothetical protein
MFYKSGDSLKQSPNDVLTNYSNVRKVLLFGERLTRNNRQDVLEICIKALSCIEIDMQHPC